MKAQMCSLILFIFFLCFGFNSRTVQHGIIVLRSIYRSGESAFLPFIPQAGWEILGINHKISAEGSNILTVVTQAVLWYPLVYQWNDLPWVNVRGHEVANLVIPRIVILVQSSSFCELLSHWFRNFHNYFCWLKIEKGQSYKPYPFISLGIIVLLFFYRLYSLFIYK